MQAHSRAFAEIDVCSRCGGAFLDAGEGVMVHGTAAEPEMLASDGKAVATGQGTLQCPAGHAGAPSMETWEVRRGEDRVEIDWCRTCGGFFLDAGEGDALLELAERTEQVIRSRDGAAFAAPPAGAEVDVVDAYRKEKGRSFFGEMARGLLSASARYRRHRRRHRHDGVNDALGSDWEW
ncbi:MAG: zf-TFIIB domain-containing protein [Sandaracinaceae bacterium]|nr:zf-TFIIB domain-containing protein [Sandaracinaceae bacterium]